MNSELEKIVNSMSFNAESINNNLQLLVLKKYFLLNCTINNKNECRYINSENLYDLFLNEKVVNVLDNIEIKNEDSFITFLVESYNVFKFIDNNLEIQNNLENAELELKKLETILNNKTHIIHALLKHPIIDKLIKCIYNKYKPNDNPFIEKILKKYMIHNCIIRNDKDIPFTADIVNDYYKSVNSYPLLDEYDEDYLFRKHSKDNVTVKNYIVNCNGKLVIRTLKEVYNYTNLDETEFLQEGLIGLMKAYEKFDISKGFKFSTYAVWWIKQYMGRFRKEKGTSVRIPAHFYEKMIPYFKAIKTLNDQGILNPSNMEIAEELNCNIKKVEEIQKYLNLTNMTSLNSLLSNEETELLNIIPDPNSLEDIAFINIDEENVKEIIEYANLTEREKDIFIRRFGLFNEDTETLQEIALTYGVTRERVRQIIGKAKLQIKKAYHKSKKGFIEKEDILAKKQIIKKENSVFTLDYLDSFSQDFFKHTFYSNEQLQFVKVILNMYGGLVVPSIFLNKVFDSNTSTVLKEVDTILTNLSNIKIFRDRYPELFRKSLHSKGSYIVQQTNKFYDRFAGVTEDEFETIVNQLPSEVSTILALIYGDDIRKDCLSIILPKELHNFIVYNMYNKIKRIVTYDESVYQFNIGEINLKQFNIEEYIKLNQDYNPYMERIIQDLDLQNIKTVTQSINDIQKRERK